MIVHQLRLNEKRRRVSSPLWELTRLFSVISAAAWNSDEMVVLQGLFDAILQHSIRDILRFLLQFLHAPTHTDGMCGGREHGQIIGAVSNDQGILTGKLQI